MSEKSIGEIPFLQIVIIIALGIAMVIAIINFHSNLTVKNVEAWIYGFGIWGPIIFILIYFVAPSLFLPASILTLAGGALFGLIWGTTYSLTAGNCRGQLWRSLLPAIWPRIGLQKKSVESKGNNEVCE